MFTKKSEYIKTVIRQLDISIVVEKTRDDVLPAVRYHYLCETQRNTNYGNLNWHGLLCNLHACDFTRLSGASLVPGNMRVAW